MTIPERCDVVVIGGGPAGSMAASYLAQKGYSVVLLEKAKHPRYVVGESLIPHFWKYCDIAGVSEKIAADGFVRKSGGTQVWNGVIRQFSFKDFGHSRGAFHVERYRFDHILIEHARTLGAQVFEEIVVSKVDLGADTASVTYRGANDRAPAKISCRFVVDASGQSAVLARQLGIRVMDEGFRFMSAWGYFLDSKYVAGDGRAYPFERLRDILPTTFVSSFADWGWAWHIPLRDTTSVGLVIPVEHVKEIKSTDEALEKYFLRQCYETPYLNRLLENAKYCEGEFRVVRDYSYRPSQLAGPGFFLIGDAAAFIDPIFSIGIVLGMYSAFLAAWAIDCAFREPSRLAQYQAIFARQFLGRLEVSRSLALPRYGVGEGASDVARASVQFQRSLEQELMYVVAVLTTRSENFMELAQTERISSDKYRELKEIVF
jgi:flavin-dependent dehydrogenase